jgi:hypothetical protein
MTPGKFVQLLASLIHRAATNFHPSNAYAMIVIPA